MCWLEQVRSANNEDNVCNAQNAQRQLCHGSRRKSDQWTWLTGRLVPSSGITPSKRPSSESLYSQVPHLGRTGRSLLLCFSLGSWNSAAWGRCRGAQGGGDRECREEGAESHSSLAAPCRGERNHPLVSAQWERGVKGLQINSSWQPLWRTSAFDLEKAS